MQVMVVTESYYVRKAFVNALIPRGMSVVHANNIQEFLSKLSKVPVDLVVFDVVNENYAETFRIMAAMKKSPSDRMKKIGKVLFVGTIEKAQVVEALKYGAVGFIKSSAVGNQLVEYLVAAYKKVKGAPPQRKFVRLSMDTSSLDERIGIKFRSPRNLQLIMGVLKDISAGGIAVELVGTFDPDAIVKGMEVQNIQFILNQKDVVVTGVVVAYNKNFCAFRFVQMTGTDQEIISNFIFEKMALDGEPDTADVETSPAESEANEAD